MRTCEMDGCNHKHEARGYCRNHYKKWRRTGDPNGVDYSPPDCSVDGCDTRAKARGLCEKHYCRWRKSGTTELQQPTTAERFWEKVDLGHPLGCWEWTGAKHPLGYGNFNAPEGHISAHRWAYGHLMGEIPEGAGIDHVCRNASCVNPDHLEPVSHRENVLRGAVGFRIRNGTWGSWT